MSDYHLSWNPMEGPTPRQERAIEVANRYNRRFRAALEVEAARRGYMLHQLPWLKTMCDVIARWEARP